MIANVPATTGFVGRESEQAEIIRLLSDPACRLLTLVGPGGIGKTRLAMHASAEKLRNFPHGVYFVGLASVNSPGLLATAIAGALKISFHSSDNLDSSLVQYLHEKQLLLVLDNFEHLLEGTKLLTDILEAAAGVKILVTSRERLNVQEEWALVLDGLAFPKNAAHDTLESYSAVQLFVQRARQIQVGFLLAENGDAVTAICQRTEGMPLGLELAATWLRAMSCRQIAAEMQGNLDFLTSPLRNVPERHRSLRAVFEQSWSLLTVVERDVLMRLSVFRGGFDREAAEQVAGASLPILAGLVDKSLIRLNPAGRYDLHELVRQYAAGKLLDAGETAAAVESHYDYCLKLAEGAEAHLFGREQVAWFDKLEVELDNLRTALTWSIETERGLQLATALSWFFCERSHWIEALNWLERTLAANQIMPHSLWSKALHSAGALAGQLGNGGQLEKRQRARALCEQALALAREANDSWNIAWSLSHLAIYTLDDAAQSATLLDECLALFREIDDPMGVAHTLVRRAWYALTLEDYSTMRLLLEEAESRARVAGDKCIEAWAAYDLGRLTWFQGHDANQAIAYFERSQSLFLEARMLFNNPLILMGWVEQALGSADRAQRRYEDAILIQDLYNNPQINWALAGLANVAMMQGQFERAATLLGSLDCTSVSRSAHNSFEYVTLASDIEGVRAQLDKVAFDEAWAAGLAMTREQAVACALEPRAARLEESSAESIIDASLPQLPRPNTQPHTDPLSSRELEILRLIADGFSNGEIADQLVVAMSTVKWHINKIFSKLEATSRTQAIVRARTLGLLT